MLVIKVKDGESIDRALRRYKKKHRNTKLRDEIRDRRYFTKLSVVRREEIKAAVYKQRKAHEE